MNDPNFNYGEFAIIKSKVSLNNYKLSVKVSLSNVSQLFAVRVLSGYALVAKNIKT